MSDARNTAAADLRPFPLPGFRLVGENGNAFAIMGRFQRCALKAGVPRAIVNAVLNKAREGDYDNLLRTLVLWEEEYDDAMGG